MNKNNALMTAPADCLGEELRTEIRRGERLRDHYRASGRKAELSMIERDLSQAKVNLSIGNMGWMRQSIETLGTYEN